MLTAKRRKTTQREGLILPETWGRYRVWGVPFTPFLWQETAKHDPTNGTAASNCRRCFANFTWRTQWTSRPVGMPNSWNLMVIWIHMKSHDNEAPRWTFWRCEDANPNFEDMNLRKLPWEWIIGKDDMMSLDAVMEMANWTFEMQVFKFSVLGCPFLKTKCFSSSMTKLLYFQAV